MKTFLEYVEEIKKKHGLTTNRQVAKALLIDPNKMSDIMSGRRNPPAVAAYRIADLLDVDPIEIRACIDYEFTKDEQAKEYIKAVFLRRMQDVAVILLVVFSMLGVGKEANAYTLFHDKGKDISSYYANYKKCPECFVYNDMWLLSYRSHQYYVLPHPPH